MNERAGNAVSSIKEALSITMKNCPAPAIRHSGFVIRHSAQRRGPLFHCVVVEEDPFIDVDLVAVQGGGVFLFLH